MALAESLYRSAQRPKTARPGERHEMHYTATFPKRLSPRGASQHLLPEVAGWQTRVLRHDVEHLSVLALDVPVPQMVDQLPDIEQFFRALSPDPEQVIEVPKILPCDAGATAGGSADDHILFLVSADCGAPSRLSSSWWWRTKFWSSMFSPLDRVQQRRLPLRNAFLSGLWSRSLTLFQVDVFMVLAQDKVHLLLSPAGVEERADEPGEGVFRTFPQNKKSAKFAPHSSPRVPASVSSSTPAAQLVAEPVPVSTEWVQLRDGNAGKTYYWNRRTRATVWKAPAGVEVVWHGNSRTEKGVLYYWHRDARVSAYHLRPLPPGRGAAPPAQGDIQILGAVPSLLCRNFLHREQWSLVLPSTWHTARVGSEHHGTAHTGFMAVRALPCGLDHVLFPHRLFGGDGFSDVLTAYGPPVSGSYFSRLVA